MIFDLVKDFADVLDAMPSEHPRRRILKLLDEAIRRDVHFIDRHADDYPQALFQCLWNTCWWYDCPEAHLHYQSVSKERTTDLPSWEQEESNLSRILEGWRQLKEQCSPGTPWLRSFRPPQLHLGTGQKAVLCGHSGVVRSVAYSPDGRLIVSGSADTSLRIWNALSGEELKCLTGHESWIWCTTFSPDGTQIVSGSWDKTVRIWESPADESGAILSVSTTASAAD